MEVVGFTQSGNIHVPGGWQSTGTESSPDLFLCVTNGFVTALLWLGSEGKPLHSAVYTDPSADKSGGFITSLMRGSIWLPRVGLCEKFDSN